jgi:hypothetical protein
MKKRYGEENIHIWGSKLRREQIHHNLEIYLVTHNVISSCMKYMQSHCIIATKLFY